jgi:CRP-like cAMP-binding protein
MELYPAYERSHFLARMPAPERRFLSEVAEDVRFEDGDVLFAAGEPAERFYVIGKGRVELVETGDDAEKVVDVLGPGELVGLSWIYEGRQWRLTARARGTVIGVGFPAEDVRHRCRLDEPLWTIVLDEITSILFDRLDRARSAIVT